MSFRGGIIPARKNNLEAPGDGKGVPPRGSSYVQGFSFAKWTRPQLLGTTKERLKSGSSFSTSLISLKLKLDDFWRNRAVGEGEMISLPEMTVSSYLTPVFSIC